nr:hypothetical protein [uncultured Mucilaginibacter sp.]
MAGCGHAIFNRTKQLPLSYCYRHPAIRKQKPKAVSLPNMADVHSKETRSYNMSRIRSKDTKPEMVVPLRFEQH